MLLSRSAGRKHKRRPQPFQLRILSIAPALGRWTGGQTCPSEGRSRRWSQQFRKLALPAWQIGNAGADTRPVRSPATDSKKICIDPLTDKFAVPYFAALALS